MSELKKVSDEQLEELRGIQQQYDLITKRYGELTYELRVIEKAMDELETQRVTAVYAIQDVMGSVGAVDLSTGEFTPS